MEDRFREGAHDLLVQEVKRLLGVAALLMLCVATASCAPPVLSGTAPFPSAPASQTAQPQGSQPATTSAGAAGASAEPLAGSADGLRVPVIVYHHVLPTASNFIAITPARFEQELRYLKSAGFTGVTASDLADALAGRTRLPKKPILITFDDGRERQIRYAVPLLQRYGFTATFFVYTSAIHDTAGTFMSRSDLKRLVNMGFDVESHTVTHKSMVRKPGESGSQYDARLADELAQSKRAIEQLTGRPVVALAYPFGYYDTYSAQALASAGYKLAFTTDDGANIAGVTPAFYLHRITVFRKQSFQDWQTLVDAGPLTVTQQVPSPGQAVLSTDQVSCVIPPLQPGEHVSVVVNQNLVKPDTVASPAGVTIRIPASVLSRGFSLVSVRVDGPSGSRITAWGFTDFKR